LENIPEKMFSIFLKKSSRNYQKGKYILLFDIFINKYKIPFRRTIPEKKFSRNYQKGKYILLFDIPFINEYKIPFRRTFPGTPSGTPKKNFFRRPSGAYVPHQPTNIFFMTYHKEKIISPPLTVSNV